MGGFAATRVLRASPYPLLASSAEADGLAPGHPENRVLRFAITVWAFPTRVGTMPAADFCRPIRMDHSTLSPDSGTNDRSPGVSSTAFGTQPPDLQPAPLMDMGFVVIGRLARHRMPRIWFLYIGSHLCSGLLSDPPSPEPEFEAGIFQHRAILPWPRASCSPTPAVPSGAPACFFPEVIGLPPQGSGSASRFTRPAGRGSGREGKLVLS
jgi:hypothetical protein